jgi:hypothetical protein
MVQADPSSQALIDRIAVSGTVAAAFITDAAGRVKDEHLSRHSPNWREDLERDAEERAV